MRRLYRNLISTEGIVAILSALNISAHISNHIVGENHTKAHQRLAGVVVMTIGVIIVKGTQIVIFHNFLIEVVVDIVGYGLHGIGLIPFASSIEKKEETNSTQKTHSN